MYNSNLPANCPPSEVEEKEISLYRLIVPGDLVESFKNHIQLFPDRTDYIQKCDAHGISLFDNIQMVESLKAKENNSDKAIAKVLIKKNYGVLTKKRSNKGHYTLWAYRHFDPTSIDYELM